MEEGKLSQEELLDQLSGKAPVEVPTPEPEPEKEPEREPEQEPEAGKVADATKSSEDSAELESLRARVKELETSPPSEFVNDTVKRLNYLIKERKLDDLTLAASLASTKVEEMGDLEVIVLKKVIESPVYKGSETLLKDKLARDYVLERPSDFDDLSDEEQRALDAEIRLNGLRLKEDAEKARGFVGEFLNVQIPEAKVVDTKALEQQKQQFTDEWKSVSPKIMEQVQKIPIPIKVGDKTETVLEFDVTDAIRKEYTKRIVEYATGAGLPHTEESYASILGIVTNAIQDEHRAVINAAIAEKARTQAIEEMKKEVHNPSALVQERKPAGGKADPQRELLDQLAPK